MNVMRSYNLAIIALLLSITAAAAQLPPPTIVAPVPNLNPSSSLVTWPWIPPLIAPSVSADL
jgi:hypothetical protein